MSVVQRTFDKVLAESVHVAVWTSVMSVGGGLGEIFVNQDARMHISPEHALPQLIQAHERSKMLTSLMLCLGGISGGLAYYHNRDKYWLIGSSLLFAGIPYHVFIENPVIEQLKYLTLDARSPRAKSLLASWGQIQFGKLALAIGGATVFYWFARH